MIPVKCESRHSAHSFYLTMNLQSHTCVIYGSDREIENSNNSNNNNIDDTESAVTDLLKAHGNRDTADTLLSLLLVFLLRLSVFFFSFDVCHKNNNNITHSACNDDESFFHWIHFISRFHFRKCYFYFSSLLTHTLA